MWPQQVWDQGQVSICIIHKQWRQATLAVWGPQNIVKNYLYHGVRDKDAMLNTIFLPRVNWVNEEYQVALYAKKYPLQSVPTKLTSNGQHNDFSKQVILG